MIGRCLVGLAFLVGITLCATAPVRAETAYLEPDSYSFFYFEGAKVGAPIPGGRIPIEATAQGQGTWRIEVAPKDFSLPEIVYPSGKRAVWTLAAPAIGSIERFGDSYRCTLSVPAVAFVDGAEGGIPMTFRFTTEADSVGAAGVVASREGVRVDPGSGYLQLIAVGVNPIHAASAPGKPFYAVLSGRLTGIPF